MKNLFNTVSYKKGAAYGAASSAVWKVLSFVNSIIIAAWFALDAGADAYFYVIMLAGLAAAFLASVNTSVIIPEAMHKEPRARGVFLNHVIVFYALLGVAACAAAPCLAAVYFAVLILTQFLINILETKRIFKVAFLYPLNALLPMAALLTLGKSYGIQVMFIGLAGAQVVQGAFCLWVMMFKMDWRFELRAPGMYSKHFFKNLLSCAALEGFGLAAGFTPVFIMSGLGGGYISALNYARALLDSPTEVITSRVTGAARINFNALAAAKDYKALNAAHERVLLILLLIMTPLCVFSTLFAREIVSVFFARGAFDARAGQNTAWFVALLMPSVLILLPSMVHRALLSAVKKIKDFLPWQAGACVISIILVIIFMQKYGPYGYPAAFLISNLLWLVISYFMLKKLMPFIKYVRTLGFMFKILGLNILAIMPSIVLAGQIESILFRSILCGVLFVMISAWLSLKFYRMVIDEIY